MYPEGLAGQSQGALARAINRGTPAALLRREAADALIYALDGFAAGGEAGIEGTASDKWKKLRQTGSYGVSGEGGNEHEPGKDGVGYEEDDLVLGDVQAAAAEAVAAAEAMEAEAEATRAAEAEKRKAAVAAAAAEAADRKEGSEEQEAKVLGSGPIWEEMKALAESKRRPLKGVRKVLTEPRQVRAGGDISKSRFGGQGLRHAPPATHTSRCLARRLIPTV